MSTLFEERNFDTYKIGEKTYKKDLYLGPKAWGKIQESSPGRFVDILESKLKSFLSEKSIDLNK